MLVTGDQGIRRFAACQREKIIVSGVTADAGRVVWVILSFKTDC
jgi:hypothetical protein